MVSRTVGVAEMVRIFISQLMKRVNMFNSLRRGHVLGGGEAIWFGGK